MEQNEVQTLYSIQENSEEEDYEEGTQTTYKTAGIDEHTIKQILRNNLRGTHTDFITSNAQFSKNVANAQTNQAYIFHRGGAAYGAAYIDIHTTIVYVLSCFNNCFNYPSRNQ